MNTGPSQAPKPFANCYWVEPGRLLAGEYPGARSEDATRRRVRALVEAGVDCFVDLTAEGELDRYDVWLPREHGRLTVRHVRRPIPDHGIPADTATMTAILDEIDGAIGRGARVYLHCRAGIGRTGTVVGCWLARRGLGGREALERLNQLWLDCGRALTWPTTPETDAQVDFVLRWQERGRAAIERTGDTAIANTLADRYRGLMLGLAVGDALGQATHHRRPGTFTPVGDLLGGGPFQLPAGAWTDETAMALCLAESLVETGRCDAADQVRRYLLWQRDGHQSATGHCLGISASTARALAAANWSRNPYAGSHDPTRAEKEPLARVGPAVAFLLADPEAAIDAAVEATRVTHQAPLTLDAVRYLAALLVGALQGAGQAELLRPLFSPIEGMWRRKSLKPEIEAVARGAWVERAPPRITGSGQAPHALEATLWALGHARSFRDGALAIVNLGGDSDTLGAVFGQLAGAIFGANGIPPQWRGMLVRHQEIRVLADRLLACAFGQIQVSPGQPRG
ncbi:MAG: ADP-ribosylglycohydrolase family protein [Steroidobacteraceae bacterium]